MKRLLSEGRQLKWSLGHHRQILGWSFSLHQVQGLLQFPGSVNPICTASSLSLTDKHLANIVPSIRGGPFEPRSMEPPWYWNQSAGTPHYSGFQFGECTESSRVQAHHRRSREQQVNKCYGFPANSCDGCASTDRPIDGQKGNRRKCMIDP